MEIYKAKANQMLFEYHLQEDVDMMLSVLQITLILYTFMKIISDCVPQKKLLVNLITQHG